MALQLSYRQIIDNAATTIDVAQGSDIEINLSGNKTYTLENFGDTDVAVFRVSQDSTGSRTLTINGIPINLTTTAFASTYFAVKNWNGVYKVYYDHSAAVLTPLSAPAVSFGTLTATSVPVNWTAVTNASNYVILRNTTNSVIGAVQIYAGSGLTYTDSGRAASTAYYYFVKAQGAGYADSAYGSGTATTTGGATQLSTPTLTATAIGPTAVNLSWTNVIGESSYALQHSLNNSDWTTINAPAADVTAYGHTGLTASTLNYYRIKAVGDGVSYSDSGYGTANATTPSASAIGSIAWKTWHDPALDTTLAGSNVLEIRTQTTNGNAIRPNEYDLRQATVADQPLYVAAGINGLPSFEISSGKTITTPVGWSPTAKPITRVLVMQLKTFTGSATRYILMSKSTSARADFGYNTSGKYFFHSGTSLATTRTPIVDEKCIFIIEYKTDATSRIYLNGVLLLEGNAGSHASIEGIRFGETTTLSAHCWIGVHGTYEGILTDTERNGVFAELATKYGISI